MGRRRIRRAMRVGWTMRVGGAVTRAMIGPMTTAMATTKQAAAVTAAMAIAMTASQKAKAKQRQNGAAVAAAMAAGVSAVAAMAAALARGQHLGNAVVAATDMTVAALLAATAAAGQSLRRRPDQHGQANPDNHRRAKRRQAISCERWLEHDVCLRRHLSLNRTSTNHSVVAAAGRL